MHTVSDKMVYGVDAAPPPTAAPPSACPGGCGGCALHPASPAPPPGIPDPWLDSDPWACQPCEPTAQEGQWHLDPFGKGKGKDKGKGERGPMACYNCLGLGHPVRVCLSEYGAGLNKSGHKCKTCGGYGHDTPTCTSQGGAMYSAPPPPKGKGKGKVKFGKGRGGSQWSKGAWVKCKCKVSAFDHQHWPQPPGPRGTWHVTWYMCVARSCHLYQS